MIWRIRDQRLDLSRRGLIMGILNVTPDSFSDGGRFVQQDAALRHARRMIDEGADIIDVGGESTRPGAAPVPAEEELSRVLPVVRTLVEEGRCLVSIDTSKAAVARAAIDAGAHVLNDVTALAGDPAMPETAAEGGAGLVLMHMRGTPRTMQQDPRYDDVVAEVGAFLRQRLADCLKCGIEADRIALDPGIGFGKTVEHNLQLLNRLPELADTGRPLVVGVSLKSFIGRLLGREAVEDRLPATVALTALCRERGARIFRVHHVRPNLEALRMTEAMLHAG